MKKRTVRSLLAITLLAIAPLTHAAVAPERDSTTASVSPDEGVTPRPSLFGGTVTRDGTHFQVAFGWGGGPDTEGLFHAMELGYTFESGWTLAYLHTFIQDEGVGQLLGGPDQVGGHLLELKMPVHYQELVVKIAVGMGDIDDLAESAEGGPGMSWAYGVDLHFPTAERSGITVGLISIHSTNKGSQRWGVALGGGYTFF